MIFCAVSNGKYAVAPSGPQLSARRPIWKREHVRWSSNHLWEFGAPLGSNYVWQLKSSNVTCSGFNRQIVIRLCQNQEYMLRKVSPEPQEIPCHGSGDLLRPRFGHMMEFEEFGHQRPLDKAQWTSEKQIRCADAQWTLDNDSQSSLASLQKLSS